MAQIPLARGASRMVRQIRGSSARLSTGGLVRSLAVRQYTPVTYRAASLPTSRFLSTTRPSLKGLSPETDNPQPKEPEPQNLASAPADLTMDEYHKFSDQYLERLVDKFEALQEQKDDIDCEYSAGILTLETPNGKYIINKQPPNKQIWLSAPESGPKRYDFVIESEGQDAKEGTGSGKWIYLRDGSNLSDLLQTEIGVDMSDM